MKSFRWFAVALTALALMFASDFATAGFFGKVFGGGSSSDEQSPPAVPVALMPHCDKPLGRINVIRMSSDYATMLGVQPAELVEAFASTSGCFTVVGSSAEIVISFSDGGNDTAAANSAGYRAVAVTTALSAINPFAALAVPAQAFGTASSSDIRIVLTAMGKVSATAMGSGPDANQATLAAFERLVAQMKQVAK